jgi:YD repeat-containing protein
MADSGGGVNAGDIDCSGACTAAVNNMLAKNAGNSCPASGNPINPATGNKYQLETVYAASGVSPLALTLEYNQVLSGWVMWGGKWKSNYERSVTRTTVNGFTSVSVMRADGKATLFLPVNGAWATDADTPEQLLELKSGTTTTGWQYTNSHNDTETYNASGKLISIADRSGLTQTLAYDASSRLASVTDALGRSLTFTYGSGNRVASMTDPASGLYSFAYDTNNNLNSITYPDGKTKTYLYENASYPGALTGITDENSNRYATYAYNAQGQAISTEHAGAVDKYTVTYNADGSSVVTDPLNAVRSYNFSTILGVVKSTGSTQPGGAGCAASAASLTYDANGNVASHTDFNGNKTTYVYDLSRNLETSRTEGLTAAGAATPATRTLVTSWHPTWRLPASITEYAGATASGTALKATAYSYDDHANLTQRSETDPANNVSRSTTISYTYSTTVPGLMLSKVIDGPRTDVNDITSYSYYDATDACLGCRGQLKSITDALGHVTQYTSYNAHGQLLSSTDANGLVTTNSYDARQRLASRTVGSETTSLQYDGVGQVTQLTLPDSSSLNYSYDAAHRLTQITDNLGNSILYTLDAMGNRTREDVKDPSGSLSRTLTRSYDALNRLQTLTGIGQD